MKHRYFLLFGFMILAGCGLKKTFNYRGYFGKTGYPKGEKFFATVFPNDNAQVPKFTNPHFVADGDTSQVDARPDQSRNYYIWKTVPIRKIVSTNEDYLRYRTFENAERDSLPPNATRHLQTQGGLLHNYLFFIDDFRFVYLSQDDYRANSNSTTSNFGDLRLYFDEIAYPIETAYEDTHEQFLRGHYHLKNDTLYLEFDGKKHFYVKAHFHQDRIEFAGIHIPEKNQYLRTTPGINLNYHRFAEIFDQQSQPIFERVNLNLGGVTRETPSFTLSFGFYKTKEIVGSKNALHKQIEGKAQLSFPGKIVTGTKITGIKYDLPKQERSYEYQLRLKIDPENGEKQPKEKFTLVESLTPVATW